MIEILGVKITYEALGFIFAFAASEIIGISKLKQNSLAQLAVSLISTLKPVRKEDDKVVAVKQATEALVASLKKLGG